MNIPMVGASLFRNLTPQEEADFRLWARQNYIEFTDINPVWHPVIQHECTSMNLEAWRRYHGN